MEAASSSQVTSQSFAKQHFNDKKILDSDSLKDYTCMLNESMQKKKANKSNPTPSRITFVAKQPQVEIMR